MKRLGLALLVQIVGLLFLGVGVYFATTWVSPPYSPFLLVFLHVVFVVCVTYLLRFPVWWLWIQAIFPAALVVAISVQFGALLALGLFVVIWLFFSNAIKERVPLYLTNQLTRQALGRLQSSVGGAFIDLGCGFGANVRYMAAVSTVTRSVGVETAPVPYLIAKLLSVVKGGEVSATSLWDVDLSQFQMVYAFLSPQPMPMLWKKVKEEMSAGSIFVSNSFWVSGVEPDEVWELNDERQTKLYIYRLS